MVRWSDGATPPGQAGTRADAYPRLSTRRQSSTALNSLKRLHDVLLAPLEQDPRRTSGLLGLDEVHAAGDRPAVRPGLEVDLPPLVGAGEVAQMARGRRLGQRGRQGVLRLSHGPSQMHTR